MTITNKGTGLPYVTAMKMKWANKEMPRVLGIASLISILILLLVTRSFRGVVVPLITAIGSIIIVYGMLGYIGMTIDSGMVMIPMLLTFVVSIASTSMFILFSNANSSYMERENKQL